MEALVTRKGQVTVPIELRRKYGIEKGMKIIFEDSTSGIILKVVPKIEDLVGIDSGKVDLQETLKMLDKMRSEDRY
jgi:bifunctional DNA-binding transcriptional regulator/antitoxin component of YhaV-PrlF toxin-antitoxin module